MVLAVAEDKDIPMGKTNSKFFDKKLVIRLLTLEDIRKLQY